MTTVLTMVSLKIKAEYIIEIKFRILKFKGYFYLVYECKFTENFIY